jgi:hypothetical protein
MRTIEQMVQQEVMCCMSSLVSTLAQGYGQPTGDAMADLVNQAFELAAPIPDYEEAALQEGWQWDAYADEWRQNDDGDGNYRISNDAKTKTAEGLCIAHGIEPYDREAFEHWAVSTWLAEKLIEQGEKVDTDFGGLNIWARTTTGQQIAADGVVERIYAAMMAQAAQLIADAFTQAREQLG